MSTSLKIAELGMNTFVLVYYTFVCMICTDVLQGEPSEKDVFRTLNLPKDPIHPANLELSGEFIVSSPKHEQ